MIWIWFFSVLAWVRRLFKLPNPADVAIVDVNAKCPCCGHKDGTILAILTKKGNDDPSVNVLHVCNICKARWIEEAVVKAKTLIPAADSVKLYADQALLEAAITKKGEKVSTVRDGAA